MSSLKTQPINTQHYIHYWKNKSVLHYTFVPLSSSSPSVNHQLLLLLKFIFILLSSLVCFLCTPQNSDIRWYLLSSSNLFHYAPGSSLVLLMTRFCLFIVDDNMLHSRIQNSTSPSYIHQLLSTWMVTSSWFRFRFFLTMLQ